MVEHGIELSWMPIYTNVYLIYSKTNLIIHRIIYSYGLWISQTSRDKSFQIMASENKGKEWNKGGKTEEINWQREGLKRKLKKEFSYFVLRSTFDWIGENLACKRGIGRYRSTLMKIYAPCKYPNSWQPSSRYAAICGRRTVGVRTRSAPRAPAPARNHLLQAAWRRAQPRRGWDRGTLANIN